MAWLFVLAFGGLAVAQASWVRSQRRDLGEMLAARAAAVGGHAIDDATIEVVRREVVVRVELVEVAPGVWGAQATAARRLPLPGRVTAGRRGFRGLAGVTVEGAVLYADDPQLAARMWSRDLSAWWRRLPQATLVIEGPTVACTAREAAPGVIAAVVELVALLAAWDDGLAVVLGSLAGAEALAAPSIGVALAPDVLEVKVELTEEGPRLVAELAGADGDGELPASVREHLARAGLAGLRTDGLGATVTWLDVETEPARIRAGVAALRALAHRRDEGPYR